MCLALYLLFLNCDENQIPFPTDKNLRNYHEQVLNNRNILYRQSEVDLVKEIILTLILFVKILHFDPHTCRIIISIELITILFSIIK
jgi:hypothetical protein